MNKVRFMFNGLNLAELVGKEIVWSGEIEKVVNIVRWKDEFAIILDVYENGFGTKMVLVRDEKGEDIHWSEEAFARNVIKVEELTPGAKFHHITERKDKAKKNFGNAFYELLKGYSALSLEEKTHIINSYLNSHDITRTQAVSPEN